MKLCCHWGVALLFTVLLGACASQPPAPVIDRGSPGDAGVIADESDDVETFAVPEADVVQGESTVAYIPESTPATVPSAPTTQSAHPAVTVLLQEADGHVAAGEYLRATASLERAIKIKPQSALLWHRLADVRLRQGELGQAVALAAKSNALAVDDRALQAKNWRLIAAVHEQRGETVAAARAQRRAIELEASTGATTGTG